MVPSVPLKIIYTFLTITNICSERNWQMAVSNSLWPSVPYLHLLKSDKLLTKLEGGAGVGVSELLGDVEK